VAFCYFTDDEELGVIKKAVNFPVFMEPDDALSALAVSRDHYRKKNTPREDPIAFSVDRDRVRRLLQKAIKEERDPVLPEALAVLKAYGIRVAPSSIVWRQDDLKSALQKIRKPIALKVISPAVSHKSDVGGVALNLRSFTEARKTFKVLEGLDPESSFGVLAQEMISGGIEVILGAKRDPSFGPVILFGLGGIYTEVFKEASMGVAPVSRSEAREMILESKASTLLKGIRGRRPSDIDAVVDNLLRLSQLMLDFPEIEGIDINPLMVREKGTVAVDARIVLVKANGS
jgi:acetyltransferase